MNDICKINDINFNTGEKSRFNFPQGSDVTVAKETVLSEMV